ncbi:MAG: L-2-amino-thiazoline-4-carboxylic acid hydrolase [Chloroflexi bacterium]|nr:L-2-amino-thiazoline-4-carboxylic acid hydrolase [Chloroflexota bacterium]
MESGAERVYKNWMHTLAQWVAVMYTVGKETGGEAFVQKVEGELRRTSMKEGERLRSRLQAEDVDCMRIGKIMDGVDESFGNYWEGYVENSPSCFEKHITTCPVAHILSGAPEICTRLLLASGQGLIAGVNPDATFRMDTTMSQGDKTCHYRVEVKKSPC